MLNFSRDSNAFANLALIDPDVPCEGKIEVVFTVWMSVEEFDL